MFFAPEPYFTAAVVYAQYLKNKAVAYIKGIKHRRARKAGLAAATQRWADKQAFLSAMALARANAQTPEERQLLKAQQYMYLYGADLWQVEVKGLERTRTGAKAIMDIETMGGTDTGWMAWGKPPSASWEGHYQGLSPEVQREQDRLMQDLQRQLKHRRDMSIGKQMIVAGPKMAQHLKENYRGMTADLCIMDELPPTPQARRDYGVKRSPDNWEIVYVQNPSIQGQRRQGLWRYVAYVPTGERLTGMTRDTALANEWLKGLRDSNTIAVNGGYEINVFI